MSERDWSVFSIDEDEGLDEAAKAAAIAEILRSDAELSRAFRLMLGGMISGKNPTQLRLDLRRKERGQPKKSNTKLGLAMIEATKGITRGHLKAVKHDVATKFGVTVRTAEAAMQRELEREEIWQWMLAEDRRVLPE